MPSKTTVWKFLNKAKEASKQATYPRQKLGSVLVYGNKVIAIGYNTNKTNPTQLFYNRYRNFKDFYSKNNGSVHSETSILLKTRFLDIDWSKATLYIYREYKGGGIALAKPCPACYAYCLERGVGTIIFTTENGYEIWKLKGGSYYE